MVKKALNSRLIGRISQKIANLCILNEKSADECFDIYMNNLTTAMKLYDIGNHKKEIIDSVAKRLKELNASAPESADAKSSVQQRRYADPLMLKVKGEVELDPTPEGLIIKKTAKTRKIKMKCPEGTKGVLIENKETGEKDKAGCQIL